MHAAYVRAWFLAGLAALAGGAFLSFLPLAPPNAAILLAAGAGFLGLALALGLLPAFARRDWPTPLYAWAAVTLAALALPLAWHERAFPALVGASLLVGAAQPLALLLSPRWPGAREAGALPHRATDAAAVAGIVVSLAATAAAGLLLIALPRGLPNAGLAVLLWGGALPAALAAFLFALPRQRAEATPTATLAYAALLVLALSTALLAYALHRPLAGLFRGPVAGLALALALGVATLIRLPRPERSRPLLGAGLALTVLAALALLLATLHGAPNALLPVAFFAALALTIVLLAAALVAASPLLLPGRAEGTKWQKWSAALLIAALFLYTPSIQYARSAAPAMIVAAAGLVILLAGLSPLARPTPTSEKRSLRRR